MKTKRTEAAAISVILASYAVLAKMQSARVSLERSSEEGQGPLFLNASRVKLISGFETPLQVTTSCGHDHNSLIPERKATGSRCFTPRRPNIAVPPLTHSKLLKGVVVVMRVAFNWPVIVGEACPLMSYPTNVNFPE